MLHHLISQTVDFLDRGKSPSLLAESTYDVLVDKGTYDAVSLDPEDSGAKRRAYIATAAAVLRPRGVLAITSCNWTEEELRAHFVEGFEVLKVLPTPQFKFGGVVGNMVTSIVFKKICDDDE